MKNNIFRMIEDEYKMNYSYLKNFLLKLTRDENLSEDIVQEVFTKLINDPEKLLEIKYTKSWLVSVAKNTLIDHFRKKSPTLLKDDDIVNDLLVDNMDPETKILNNEIIKMSLNKLTIDERNLFLAREYYGYSYEDISVLLDLPATTIKSRLFRIRKKIVQHYEGRGKDE